MYIAIIDICNKPCQYQISFCMTLDSLLTLHNTFIIYCISMQYVTYTYKIHFILNTLKYTVIKLTYYITIKPRLLCLRYV